MTTPAEEECPHLYVVGDTRCRICLEDIRSGLLYWSTDRATVGLEVREGVVIDAPPYARKWALGRRLTALPPAEESLFVTDVSNPVGTDDDGVDWGDAGSPEAVASWTPDDVGAQPAPRTSYPEYPPLAEAPISINFKITGEPMITVRGHDAAQITALLNDMSNGGVWANIAAAQADLRTQGGLGAGLGPVSPVGPPAPPPAPQGGYGAPPAQGPPFGPNVSVPQAPGYQGPPQQSYPSGPPPQQQWQQQGGYGGGGYNQQDSKPEPAMQPPGWMRVNARSGPGFDAWKNLREQQKDYLKGKIKWGGKADYWIEPSIAQWLAQQGFAVSQ